MLCLSFGIVHCGKPVIFFKIACDFLAPCNSYFHKTAVNILFWKLQLFGLEAYLQYFNKTDATVIKGIEILEKGEAFPKAPVAVEEEEVTKDKKDGKKKRTAQAYSITEDPTRGFDYAKAAIS